MNFFETTTFMKKLIDSKLDKNTCNNINYFLSINAKLEEHKQGSILFRIGDKGEKFYIILQGTIGVLKPKQISKTISIREYIYFLNNLKNKNEIYLFEKCINTNIEKIFIKERLFNKIFELLIVMQGGNCQAKPNSDILYSNFIDIDFTDKNDENDNDLKEYFLILKENKFYNFFLEEYEKIVDLKDGFSFGDFALESTNRQRTATIRMECDTYLAVISQEDYGSYLQREKKRYKMKEFMFLYEGFFHTHLVKDKFEKYYFQEFIYEEYPIGHILELDFKKQINPEDKNNYINITSSLYLLKEGQIEISLNKNLIDLFQIITMFVNCDSSLKTLFDIEKYNKYLFKKLKSNFKDFEKKRSLSIMKIGVNDILGVEEFYYKLPFVFQAKVISEKVCLYKLTEDGLKMMLDREGISKKFMKEHVLNKLSNKILRLVNLNSIYVKMVENESESYKLNNEKVNRKENKEKTINLEDLEFLNNKKIKNKSRNYFNNTNNNLFDKTSSIQKDINNMITNNTSAGDNLNKNIDLQENFKLKNFYQTKTVLYKNNKVDLVNLNVEEKLKNKENNENFKANELKSNQEAINDNRNSDILNILGKKINLKNKNFSNTNLKMIDFEKLSFNKNGNSNKNLINIISNINSKPRKLVLKNKNLEKNEHEDEISAEKQKDIINNNNSVDLNIESNKKHKTNYNSFNYTTNQTNYNEKSIKTEVQQSDIIGGRKSITLFSPLNNIFNNLTQTVRIPDTKTSDEKSNNRKQKSFDISNLNNKLLEKPAGKDDSKHNLKLGLTYFFKNFNKPENSEALLNDKIFSKENESNKINKSLNKKTLDKSKDYNSSHNSESESDKSMINKYNNQKSVYFDNPHKNNENELNDYLRNSYIEFFSFNNKKSKTKQKVDEEKDIKVDEEKDMKDAGTKMCSEFMYYKNKNLNTNFNFNNNDSNNFNNSIDFLKNNNSRNKRSEFICSQVNMNSDAYLNMLNGENGFHNKFSNYLSFNQRTFDNQDMINPQENLDIFQTYDPSKYKQNLSLYKSINIQNEAENQLKLNPNTNNISSDRRKKSVFKNPSGEKDSNKLNIINKTISKALNLDAHFGENVINAIKNNNILTSEQICQKNNNYSYLKKLHSPNMASTGNLNFVDNNIKLNENLTSLEKYKNNVLSFKRLKDYKSSNSEINTRRNYGSEKKTFMYDNTDVSNEYENCKNSYYKREFHSQKKDFENSSIQNFINDKFIKNYDEEILGGNQFQILRSFNFNQIIDSLPIINCQNNKENHLTNHSNAFLPRKNNHFTLKKYFNKKIKK